MIQKKIPVKPIYLASVYFWLPFALPTLIDIATDKPKNENANILYLHTKGVSYDKSLQTVNNWIDYMLYYLVERHKECIELLDTTNAY